VKNEKIVVIFRVKDNALIKKSKEFALNIIKFCDGIKNVILANQLLKSGTSVGANIHEANYAQSKADFISKLQIALKECYESEYWIVLITESGIASNGQILSDCRELKRILIASCRTAKENG